MTIAVISVCSVWFLLWVLYIFKPGWLGRLAYPLHITGWANNWSMFVENKNARLRGTYNIFYKDFNQASKTSEWVLMPKVTWHPTMSLIGLGVRKETLLRHFTKAVLKDYRNGIAPHEHPFFNSLCQLVLTHRHKTAGSFRQIKIEYYPSGTEKPVIIESEILSV